MITIDSNVAAKWFVAEPDADRAHEIAGRDDLLCAPDLLLAEVGNVFWKACRQQRATPEAATQAMAMLPEFFDEIIPHAAHTAEAMRLSLLLDHPIYDCFYLAVAQAREAPLITADSRLLRKVAGTQYEQLVQRL